MKSFEELKNIQAEHEKKVEAEKEAKRIAEEEAAGKKTRVQAGYKEREEAMGEADAANQELTKMRIEDIEERIAGAERLRQDEANKHALIQDAERRMAYLEKEIKAIGGLVKGKEKKMIAQEIIESIKTTGSEHVAAKKEAERIINELRNVSSDRISREEIDAYVALQKKIDTLVQKITEIEANQDVVDLLFEEAKEEDRRRESEAGDAIRQVVVQAALRGVFLRTYTPDFVPEGLIRYKRDFLERVCKQFIEEEAHAKGIDAIRGRDERLKALQELCRELVEGIDADDRRKSVEVESPEIRSGYALRRMLKSGINRNFLHILMPQDRARERRPETRTYEDREKRKGTLKEDLDAGIARHLKTLNLIRAWSFGWNNHQYRDFVFPSSNSDWSSLRQQMLDAGSDFTPIHQGGGPFVSKKADRDTSKEIAEQFTKEREDAQNLEKKFAQETEKSMEEEIRQLEERRNTLAREQERADHAEKEIKAVENEEKKYHIDYTDPALSERLKNTILNIEKISGGLRLTIGTIERMLENIGLFQFSQKKFQRGQIESKRSQLADVERRHTIIQGLKERLDAAEKTLKETGRSYDIQKDLNRTISELKEKENRLKIFRAGER